MHPCRFRDAPLVFRLLNLTQRFRSIYQFLIAVRQKDGTMLMNENGDVTR